MSVNDRIEDLELRMWGLEKELAGLRRVLEAGEEEPAASQAPPPLVLPAVEAPPAPVAPPPEPSPAMPPPDLYPKAAAPSDRWFERSREPSRDVRMSDRLGARTLAWTGGVVTVFGIVLFFALAVNRGWIGPGARVVLGACASAIVFGAGLVLRRRYGETHAALAAIGAGIAGAYVTLLAAGPYYDLLPDWAALVLAAMIAAIALALALRWPSELVAGLGIVGALAVPVPIAWGDGVTTTGTAFVAVMFAAAAAVSVARGWKALLGVSAMVVFPQVLALAAEHHSEAGPLIVASVCSATMLAAGIGFHLRARPTVEPFQATVIMAAALLSGLSSALLLDGKSQGYALLFLAAVYGIVAAVWYSTARRRDLSLFLFAVALAVGAIGCADLLSGTSLGIVWAAESAVLAWLATRTRDLRIQLASLVYLVLAIGHVILIDTPPNHLFTEQDDPAAGVLSLLAVSVACAVFSLRCAAVWREPRMRGVFRALSPLLRAMQRSQTELRFATGLLSGVTVVYAASLGLLEFPGEFEWHQVAVTSLYAIAPLAVLVVGLLLPSLTVQVAAAVGFVLAVEKDIGFDLTQLDAPQRSWTMIVTGAALLAGGFLYYRLTPDLTGLNVVAFVVAATVVYAILGPVDLLEGRWHGVSSEGAALLVPVAVYACLAALVFRIARLQDLTTVLWAEALAVAIVSAAFLFDGTATAVAWSFLAIVLVVLIPLVGEQRFQYGAAVCVGLAAFHAVVLDAPPTKFFVSSSHPASGAGAVAAAALAAFALALVVKVPQRLGDSSAPLLVTVGVLATYALSLVVLELFQLGGNTVETEFERGHAAVSSMWGLAALLLLYLGLTRRLSLRIAGFAFFGITLAKIFLYDLATLSPVARALSFLAVGAVLLLGGFFYQRLSADALRRRDAVGG